MSLIEELATEIIFIEHNGFKKEIKLANVQSKIIVIPANQFEFNIS